MAEYIPNELLLEIFQHLPYRDLKLGIAPTCRRFKSIIDDAWQNRRTGRLALKLFRHEGMSLGWMDLDLHYRDDLIHPVLAKISYVYPDPIEKCLVEGGARLIDLPVAHESASHPPVRKVVLAIGHPELLQNRYAYISPGPSGAVSVLDVMNGFINLLKKRHQLLDAGEHWDAGHIGCGNRLFGRKHMTTEDYDRCRLDMCRWQAGSVSGSAGDREFRIRAMCTTKDGV